MNQLRMTTMTIIYIHDDSQSEQPGDGEEVTTMAGSDYTGKNTIFKWSIHCPCRLPGVRLRRNFNIDSSVQL